MTRGAVTASALTHVAILATLFVVRPPTPIIVPGPDVVQVALLDASAIGAPPPSPAAPKEDPRDMPAPTDEEGVKLEKPKPKPKTPQVAQPTRPREPAKEPARDASENPSLPWAPVGNAGLKGQVAVDDKNFEFTYYLLLVRGQIASRWAPPAGLGGRAEPVRATVYFRIARDGSVHDIRLESASGLEFFDATTTRAVLISAPLPPLPLGYAGSQLGVHFGFEYAGP